MTNLSLIYFFREKICAIFSLLMINFSVVALGKFGDYSNWASRSCLDSFAGHVLPGKLFSTHIVCAVWLCLMLHICLGLFLTVCLLTIRSVCSNV